MQRLCGKLVNAAEERKNKEKSKNSKKDGLKSKESNISKIRSLNELRGNNFSHNTTKSNFLCLQ